MQVQGRERLSRVTIDGRAKKLLLYVDKDHFAYTKATDLRKIASFLTEKHDIKFDFNATIGFAEDGGKIIGAYHARRKTIIIDTSLSLDEQKFNFTLAHELGHLALHRKLKFAGNRAPLPVLEKQIPENYTDIEWIEWQANKYAIGLLLPDEMITTKMVKVRSKMGYGSSGAIIINDHPQSRRDATTVIEELSRFFGVSKSSIRYRLHDLELIKDMSWQPQKMFDLTAFFSNEE